MNNDLLIIPTDNFTKEYKRLAKKYPSIKTDLKLLVNDMRINPSQGVDLGHGIKKIRLAIKSKGKGKSGGARVISLNLFAEIELQKIILVAIFDKSENESISITVIKRIISESGF